MAGLVGAALALGGLVTPVLMPRSFAVDVTLSSLIIDNKYSDIMMGSDGKPLSVDSSTDNLIVPSGGTAKWSVVFTPNDAGSLTLTATLPVGSRFEPAATAAGCPGSGAVTAAPNVARCTMTNAPATQQQWDLSATV